MTYPQVLPDLTRKSGYKDLFSSTSPRVQLLWVAALAGLLSALSFLPFALLNGGVLNIVADFNEQQTSFNILLNRIVRTGSFPFSWSLDLGGSVIGAFSFYNLTSPFFWLSALFPPEWFPYLLAPLYILKYTVAAITAHLYLRTYLSRPSTRIWASLLYAFSSFQAINLMFNHFHDVVAFFPLLLLSADALAKGRRGPFLFCVAFSALLNFFFFVGEVVFLLFYFLWRYVYPNGRMALRLLPRFLLEGSLGVGLSLFILLPSFFWTLGNPRTNLSFVGIDAFIYPVKNYLNFLKAFFLPADPMATETTQLFSDYSSTALWLPFVGCFLVWIFCWQKGFHAWLRGLLLTLLTVFCIPVLNSLFYALNPTYYARWFYMPILLFCLASGFVWEKAKGLKRLTPACVSYLLLWSITLLSYLVLREVHAAVGSIRRSSAFGLLLLVSSICWIFTLILLIREQRGKHATIFLLIGIWLVGGGLQVVNVYDNQAISYRTRPDQAWYSTIRVSKHLREFARQNPFVQKGYRLVNREERTNATLAADLPSISSFLSTVNGNITRFYNSIGSGRYVISRNTEPEVQTFLGVGYEFSTFPLSNRKIVWKSEDPEGSTYIYEHPDALPIAYCMDHYIPSYRFNALTHEERLRTLLRALVLTPSPANSSIGSNRGTGESSQWIQTRCKRLDDTQLFRKDSTYQNEILEKRRAESGYDFKYSGEGLRFKVRAEAPKVVLVTTPFDKGWTCSVNNQEVEPEWMNGLLVLPVEAGVNQIEMRYHLVGFRQGILLSVCALLLSCLYLWIFRSQPTHPKCTKESRSQRNRH